MSNKKLFLVLPTTRQKTCRCPVHGVILRCGAGKNGCWKCEQAGAASSASTVALSGKEDAAEVEMEAPYVGEEEKEALY